ncbi:MAG: (Fe-S)-binding protein, partial [Syntrophales bacterium]|nr:(Fe-S)-binding protein [Syntrophales bacterium]
ATCTSTIKKMWPLMIQEGSAEERARVAFLADKVLDVSQFLVEKVGLAAGDLSKKSKKSKKSGKEKVAITYHDPCHLKKSLGVAGQPRALIRANGRYELKEMAEADWCCGCGGSFNLQQYEISAAIGRRKRDHVLKSGAQIVATGCPACMLQLTDMLSQAGARVQVKHAVEIYAEILAGTKD